MTLKPTWTKLLTIPAITLTLAAFIWIDTAPYRTALNDLLQTMPASALARTKADLEADLGRIDACKENAAPQEFEYTRSCLLDSLPQIRTMAGALIATSIASTWLTKNPDDEKIRAAALAAIDGGRFELMTANSRYADKLEKITAAHNQSITLRLLNGRQVGTPLFESIATMLNKAEYRLLLPNVAQQQFKFQRRLETPQQDTSEAAPFPLS